MSHTLSKATVVAVSASISTPVFSVAETVAVTSTPEGIIVVSIVVFSIFSGWQSGRSSWVRFAAIIPASSLTGNGFPFSTSPFRKRVKVLGLSFILPEAVATLYVIGFFDMSACLKVTKATCSQSSDISLQQIQVAGAVSVK